MTDSKLKGGDGGLSPYNQVDTRTPNGKPSSPLVIVASHRKVVKEAQAQEAIAPGQATADREGQKVSSLYQFQRTELGANFNKVFKDKRLPFKYRTLVYLQKILFSKEVESDIKQFRTKEEKVRQHWQYEHKMAGDIKRTKFLKDNPGLHADAKRIVEYYCHVHNVSYCQGMLEVLMPFLLMKQRVDDQGEEQVKRDPRQYQSTLFGADSGMLYNDAMSTLSKSTKGNSMTNMLQQSGHSPSNFFDLACVYAFFKRFVRSFIPNNLHTKFNGRSAALPYLKCCLQITDLLLQYADKEIYAHLKRKKVVVEMYAPGWVTTLYSRVVEFGLLYELWEIFLFERDKFFIFYFAVALLVSRKEEILALDTMEQLLAYLCGIKIESFALLADTYFHAIQIRRNTPVSFQMFVSRLGIFDYNPIISNEELESIDRMGSIEWMPIYPKELVQGS